MAKKTEKTDIHAFTAGSHKTRLGHEVTISEADLQASAAAYNPELHEAPLVIGHPEGTAPAYGWVASCHTDGGKFFVAPKQVNPEFAELHNSGAFKKRSMSFYHPDNNQNPVPGVWYPRHLGFLGAQPPAIKGLSDFSFEELEGDTLTVDFGEWTDRVEVGLWRRLREFFISEHGKDIADEVIPSWDVGMLQEEAAKPSEKEIEPVSPAFSESQTQHKEGDMTPEELAAQKAELAQQKINQDAQAADFSEREAGLAKREKAAHKTVCADFVESQVEAGKVLPAQKDNLIAFMSGLEHVETVDFAEGDATVKKSPLAYMQEYLAAQPKIVDFGEHLGGKKADAVNMEDADALAAAAVEFQESEAKAGRTISVTQAVSHVKNSQGDK